jgi:hypothetical protein
LEQRTSSPEVAVQEYSALISKMGSNESWAYSFVALYFAFLSSIGTAVGFLLAAQARTLKRSDAAEFDLWFEPRSMLIALTVLAVLLNIWAISMVWDYKREARILQDRLCEIEMNIGGGGFMTRLVLSNRTTHFRFGQMTLVGSVMFMFFVPWLLLLFRQVFS